MSHRMVAQHTASFIDAPNGNPAHPPVVMIECSCGGVWEPHVWARHLETELARTLAAATPAEEGR